MSKKLSRRRFLKGLGVTAAGAAIAACQPKTVIVKEEVQVEKEVTKVVEVEKVVKETVIVEGTPQTVEKVVKETVVVEVTPTPVPLLGGDIEGHVVVMHFLHEFTEDHQKVFGDKNPGITTEVIQADLARFYAMTAAGAPPDLLRLQAPSIPQYLTRGLLYDLTPFFEVSDVLKLEDLAEANDYYKANSPLSVGAGPIYGMCKDFSPDFTIWMYDQAFEDVDLTPPSDAERMTYQEVYEYAQAVAKFEGDRTLMFGVDFEAGWIDRIMENILQETGASLYDEGMGKMTLVGNEAATDVAKYFFDLAKERLTASPINPSPSWMGDDFDKGILAMCQYGYWFSPMAETDINKGKVRMLPGPTWSGVARDPTMTATGMIMSSATKVPQAAWKVFEFYNGEEPAIERAGSGWGVPALKSMYELMPSETEYQQQVQKVLREELALATPPLQFNPFIGETTTADSWNTHLDRALRDEIGFDELIETVEAEVNLAIQEGVDRLL
jgi:multiple sugar transport system substrate-binding protein